MEAKVEIEVRDVDGEMSHGRRRRCTLACCARDTSVPVDKVEEDVVVDLVERLLAKHDGYVDVACKW